MLYSVTIPIDLTNGNDGRGSKWFSSSKRRKKIERDLRFLGLARKPFGCVVDITITRILGKGERLWDADSIGRGSAKELIDALVAVGWFEDDGPRHIRNCDYRQDDTLRHIGPAVRIEVRRAAEIPRTALRTAPGASEAPETPADPKKTSEPRRGQSPASEDEQAISKFLKKPKQP